MSASVPYTRRPRPTLWLVRGGELTPGGLDIPSLYISKNPITNEEYEAYMEHVRAETSPGPNHPAVNVSYANAAEYCRRYAEASGKPFRLPTQLEWEYSCRADATTRYFWGDRPEGGAPHCWDADVSDGRTREVEQGTANGYGLYDMLGNVWEWTRRDVDNPAPGGLCGGSFRTPREQLGCSIIIDRDTRCPHDDVGFRIVRLL